MQSSAPGFGTLLALALICGPGCKPRTYSDESQASQDGSRARGGAANATAYQGGVLGDPTTDARNSPNATALAEGKFGTAESFD